MNVRRKRRIDGVLFLDKPQGMSSNAALQRSRRMLEAAKAGHTGTLDPMATGLLPLTFGEATKFSQMLLDADKEYVARVQFGFETDTGDAEGKALSEPRDVRVERAALEAVLPAFRGEIEQVPPMYSALKRDGKPLYEYARAGIELERKPRRVHIHTLELLDCPGTTAELRVGCSKGTYIRTLAIDIGRALGCGAHLVALRRTLIGDVSLDEALTLDALEAHPAPTREQLLAPADRLVCGFPALELDQAQAEALLHGQNPGVDGLPAHATVRVYGPDKRFLGLARISDASRVVALRLVSTAPGGA